MKRIVMIGMVLMLLLAGSGDGHSLQNAEVIHVNTDQNASGYVPGEDYQQNWNDWGSDIGQLSAASEDGYYYYDRFGDSLLHFHDFASGQTVVLCNRPDCDHKSVDCNATVSGMEMLVQYLQFYDGNVTDTGLMGTVTYSMEGQESTGLGTMSHARAYVKG